MAAEIVGTAYVRIRAITAGLAKDISDGVDKGVKDAGPDVEKAGEVTGEDLGKGTTKSFKKTVADGIPDGVSDALDSPAVHKAGKDGGSGIAEDVREGIDKENRRRNPFSSLLDSLRNIRRDKDFDLPDLDLDLPDVDVGGWFSDLGDDAEDGGEQVAGRVRDGIEKENKRRNPFESLADAFGKLDIMPGKAGGILAALGPTTLAPIIGSVLAGLALITQALGFVVTAAAGAGVAVAGIAAVALPGIGVLLAAFKTETEELKEFKQAAKDLLAPWKAVGVATQKTLLPGLKEALKTIGGNNGLISMFEMFGSNIGQTVGDMAHFGSAVLTSEKNMSALATILSASEDFFTNIRDAVIAFADAMLPFFAAAAPLAVQFSESLAGMAQHFADFINQKSATGELTATFQTWYDRAATLVDIFGNIFSLLWSILSIGADAGTPFFDRIAEATQKWSDWASSEDGQNRIKKFFDDAQPVIDEIFRLVGNVFDLLVTPATSDGGATMFSNLAGALEILNEVLENPITAQIVPFMLGLVVSLKLLSLLAGPISAVGTAFSVLGTGISALGTAASGIGSVLSGLGSTVMFLISNPVGWVLLAIAAAAIAVYFAFKYWDEITAALQLAWEWFMKLSTPMKVLVTVLGAMALLLVPIVAPLLAFAAAVLAIVWAIKNWDTIVEIVMRVKDAILGFIEAIPGLINQLPGLLLQAGEAIVSFFTGLPAVIGEALSGIAEALRTGLLDAIRALPSLLLDALGGMWELGENILGLIADGLQAALPVLAEFFIQLPVNILDLVGSAAAEIIGLGVKFIAWLIQGLVQAIPEVLTFFLQLPFEIGTLVRKAGVAIVTALVQGLIEAGPKVQKWFQDLPGNIISMMVTAAKWLLETGSKIIDGLWQGIQASWDKIITFFQDLPGKVIGFLVDAGGWLVDTGAKLLNGLLEGVMQVGGSVDEYFMGLPAKILGLLGDLFGFIWEGIVAGSAAFLSNVDNWIVSIVTSLAGLPAKALGAIGDLGMTIWNAITSGFSTALTNVGTWVSEALTKLGNFARDAPGKVAGFVTSLPAKIGEATVAALSKITDWVEDALGKFGSFAVRVPGKLASLMGDIGGKIGDALDNALKKIGDWVEDALKAVGRFVTGIPGKLAGAASDLASGVYGALKKAWNAAVDRMPTLKSPEIFGHSITISADFLKLAQGAIVGGSPFGTLAVLGEGGRDEAVIPMTRPTRALALMQASGLDKLVLNAALKDDEVTMKGLGGDVTMLHMDHATFVAPIDADIVIQKIASAYRRMAS